MRSTVMDVMTAEVAVAARRHVRRRGNAAVGHVRGAQAALLGTGLGPSGLWQGDRVPYRQTHGGRKLELAAAGTLAEHPAAVAQLRREPADGESAAHAAGAAAMN